MSGKFHVGYLLKGGVSRAELIAVCSSIARHLDLIQGVGATNAIH